MPVVRGLACRAHCVCGQDTREGIRWFLLLIPCHRCRPFILLSVIIMLSITFDVCKEMVEHRVPHELEVSPVDRVIATHKFVWEMWDRWDVCERIRGSWGLWRSAFLQDNACFFGNFPPPGCRTLKHLPFDDDAQLQSWRDTCIHSFIHACNHTHNTSSLPSLLCDAPRPCSKTIISAECWQMVRECSVAQRNQTRDALPYWLSDPCELNRRALAGHCRGISIGARHARLHRGPRLPPHLQL
jgi:hypothetical protein